MVPSGMHNSEDVGQSAKYGQKKLGKHTERGGKGGKSSKSNRNSKSYKGGYYSRNSGEGKGGKSVGYSGDGNSSEKMEPTVVVVIKISFRWTIISRVSRLKASSSTATCSTPTSLPSPGSP